MVGAAIGQVVRRGVSAEGGGHGNGCEDGKVQQYYIRDYAPGVQFRVQQVLLDYVSIQRWRTINFIISVKKLGDDIPKLSSW